jgi:L-alanine-DL-glutamate epimerase-like enolase superfamily enzyme
MSKNARAIQSVEIFPVHIEHNQQYSNWGIAKASTAPGNDTNIIVKLVSVEGVVGFGEVGRYYERETPTSVSQTIRRDISDAIIGLDATNIASVREAMDNAIDGNWYAKSAVEMAVHDLAGKILDIPVSALLGGACRTAIALCPSIGIREEPEVAADLAARFESQGYRDLKFKVGLDFERDQRSLELIREKVKPDFRIRIDPNQAYGPEDALEKLRRLGEYDLLMIEQPVDPSDIATLSQLSAELEAPIFADEQLNSASKVIDLACLKVVRGVMVKPARCGGLQAARELANTAKAADLSICVGSMRELGLATAAYIHFAASIPGLSMASNLAGPALFLCDDILEEMLQPIDGCINVPDGPGLGVVVDEEKLSFYAATPAD